MESWLQTKNYVLFFVLFLLLITIGNSDSSGNSRNNDTATRANSTTKSLIESSDKPFRCYTCSWSEMANSSLPNIDVCSSYRFVPEAAAIAACDYGCQTVSYRATKTSDTRHFHRNCLKKSEDRAPRDKCVINYSKSYGFEEICECMTNMCNEASSNYYNYRMYNWEICFGVLLVCLLQNVPTWRSLLWGN